MQNYNDNLLMMGSEVLKLIDFCYLFTTDNLDYLLLPLNGLTQVNILVTIAVTAVFWQVNILNVITAQGSESELESQLIIQSRKLKQDLIFNNQFKYLINLKKNCHVNWKIIIDLSKKKDVELEFYL
jgi:hypothetical protein